MEWIETTAKSVDEARDLALEKLGVDDADADIEVLEEPRPGLFGRVRGQARVRARVAPKAPRAKEDGQTRGRGRRKGGDTKVGSAKGSSEPGAGAPSGAAGGGVTTEAKVTEASSTAAARDEGTTTGNGSPRSKDTATGKPAAEMPEASAEEVAEGVSDFLAGLVQAFGFDSEILVDVSGNEISANVDEKLGLLVGPKGRTLDAIQELARASAGRATPSSARIRVDVGGYRDLRRSALEAFAQSAAERAAAEQVEVVLEPMSSPDRKAVHDALNGVAGITTRSAGNEPRRRVVIVPAGDQPVEADA